MGDHQKELEALQRAQDESNKRIFALEQFQRQHLELHIQMMKQLKPISDVFNNVNGFRSVSILFLKGLVLVGAGVAVLVGLIKWLKQ